MPRPPCEVLDVGGGPGRYAMALAIKGYSVTLVDLSRGNLEFARKKSSEADIHLEDYIQADACHLDFLLAGVFDVVLLMGPLYHLLEVDERQLAVQEAYRVLKSGGLIFAAFITRFSPFRFAAVKDVYVILNDSEYGRHLLETGKHDRPENNTKMYFSHPNEVLPLMEEGGFLTLQLIGSEGIVAGHEDEVNKLTGKAWETWVDLNYQLSQEKTLLGASDHLLYVGKKE